MKEKDENKIVTNFVCFLNSLLWPTAILLLIFGVKTCDTADPAIGSNIGGVAIFFSIVTILMIFIFSGVMSSLDEKRYTFFRCCFAPIFWLYENLSSTGREIKREEKKEELELTLKRAQHELEKLERKQAER